MKDDFNVETALAVLTCMGVLYVAINLYAIVGGT